MAPGANLWFLVLRRGFRSSLTQNGRQCPAADSADPPEKQGGYKVYKGIALVGKYLFSDHFYGFLQAFTSISYVYTF